MIHYEGYSIFIHRDSIDFRKSIDGLSGLVTSSMNLDVKSKALFLFRNKHRNKIKILYWDITGYALWYKRLDKNKFPWPSKNECKTIELTTKQLEWLLKGIDYWSIQSHQEYESNPKLFLIK